ncbi:MAG: MBL fold metallo-hydrolase [bacterium]
MKTRTCQAQTIEKNDMTNPENLHEQERPLFPIPTQENGQTSKDEETPETSVTETETRPSPASLRDGELDILLHAYEGRMTDAETLHADEQMYLEQLRQERQVRMGLAETLEGRETVEQIREGMWLLRKEKSVNPVTVVFRRGDQLLVTDPGVSWHSKEKNRDLRVLEQTLGAKVNGILLTHSHPDHIGNLPEIVDEEVPVYVHPKGFWSIRSPQKLLEAENVLAERGDAPKLFPNILAERLYPLVMKAAYGPRLRGMKKEGERTHRVTDTKGETDDLPIKEGGRRYQRFPEDPMHCDGYTVEVVETPGHTPGEVSFWIPEDRILVGGDLIPNTHFGRDDIASLYMPEANIYDAITSLERIKDLKPVLFIPTHGEPIRTEEALQERVDTMLKILHDIIQRVHSIRAERPGATIQQLADEVFADDPRFPKTSKFGPIEKRTIVMSVLRDAHPPREKSTL